MMQQPPPAANGAAAAGSGRDQQAYHHQQWMMMQQQQQGQPPAGWNPQSSPSLGQQQQYGGGSQNPGSGGEIRSLWIGDLQPWMDESYLRNIFSTLTGEVQQAKVIRNKQSGYSEGYGFIEFVSHAAAERILQTYNGAQMPGCEQTFRLNWAQLGAGERRQADGPEHTVFVGDLAPDVTDYMLTETFKAVYSSVKGAKVVTDRTTGRSKGYGFVKFGDESEQIRAITEMNGQYCSSRPMRTGPAANKKPLTMQQPGAYQSTQGNPGESDPTNTTIFVGALDESVTEDGLKSVFGQFGELVHVKIPAGKRCGFVQYANRACAEQALNQLNGTQLGGQSIRLSWGRSPNNKQTHVTQPDQGYYGYPPPQGYEGYGYAPPPQDPSAYYGGYPGAGYGNYHQQPGGYQQ
ncbi:PREDICTED: polyadenylate-binding protein RBP45C-like [Brassica oleracea var. oleracea]|uniref:RRM domain-containing protein n=1 Tax=Brassica oleracea var. oleracea TaxID=109376 RepID=A0A0D3A6T1_BRAOL|nr:PREDICTED: polyadenylate-binding protein RBP45C-like [Brassica oleracea var. oleracea]